MTAAVPRGSRRRGTAAALVLGSIFPDADLILVLRGFDLYLDMHAAGTHSLVWSFAEAVVFGCLLRPLVRGSRIGVLILAGWAGIVGHIASDCIDGSDIMLFAPLSKMQYGWHLFGMAETFVWVLLGAACLVAWRIPARARLAAWFAFTSLASILAFKAATQRQAAAIYQAASNPRRHASFELAPVRNRLFEWDVYDEDGDRIRAWRIDARSGASDLLFERRNATGPLVTASASLPIVRGLRARTTIALVRVEHAGDGTEVLWSDARMCDARRCDVSLGGIFRPDGVASSQIIRVGGFQQHRPLPRE